MRVQFPLGNNSNCFPFYFKFRQYTNKRNIQALSRNNCCRGKAMCYKTWMFAANYPACNVRSVFYIVICCLPGSTLFFHIISLSARFWEKKLLNIKFVFWFSLQILYKIFFILRRTELEFIVYVHMPSSKV